jgi:hypothetical protein
MKMKASIIALSALVGMFGNASAAFISPIAVSDPGSFGSFTGGTFQADPNLYSDATATTYIAPDAVSDPDRTWLNDAGSPVGDVFDITLDQNYDLTSFYLWNYKHDTGDFSVAAFTVATSSTETGDNFGATIPFTASAGAVGTAAANGTVDTFGSFSASDVRRVRFTITAVHEGGNGLIGLNEFAFEGSPIPEPGSLALAGVVVAIGMLARRRRH